MTTAESIATIVDDERYELVAYTRQRRKTHVIVALFRLIDLDVPFCVLSIDEEQTRVLARSNVRESHLSHTDAELALERHMRDHA